MVSTDFPGCVDCELSFVVCVHSVEPPSAARSALQRDGASDGGMDGAAIAEAFPWDSAPGYVPHDRDGIYGASFPQRVDEMGIREVLTAPRSP